MLFYSIFISIIALVSFVSLIFATSDMPDIFDFLFVFIFTVIKVASTLIFSFEMLLDYQGLYYLSFLMKKICFAGLFVLHLFMS